MKVHYFSGVSVRKCGATDGGSSTSISEVTCEGCVLLRWAEVKEQLDEDAAKRLRPLSDQFARLARKARKTKV